MSKKIWLGLGAVLVLVAVAAGSFYGGLQYQLFTMNSVRDQFLANRGVGQGGNFPNGTGNGVGGPGRGTLGQIKSIDGNTLTLSTPQSVVTVTLSDATVVEKTVPGTHSDLQIGQQVVVRGQADAAGNITADTIQLTNQPTPSQ